MLRKFIVLSALLVIICNGISFGYVHFIENKGQWNPRIRFKIATGKSTLILNANGLIWINHNLHHDSKPEEIKAEALALLFDKADVKAVSSIKKSKVETQYSFHTEIGSFSTTASNEVIFKNIYPKIDVRWYEWEGTLKYDFIIHQGADIKHIVIVTKGFAKSSSENGIITATGNLSQLVQEAPISFDSKGVKYQTSVLQSGNRFTFTVKGHPRNKEFVIDPTLRFSTLSGSSADNWGTTATYDAQGNAYTGGMVFSSGYPTTFGSFQPNFVGRQLDAFSSEIGIQKFSPDGRTLMYCTYIGGSQIEIPHSMVADPQGNLYILGSTSSSNYPLQGAFQRNFGGGNYIDPYNFNFVTFRQGSDLVLSKLNFNGSALLASSYLGGSANDGVLSSESLLRYNYGDQFRGEINLDQDGNVVIASSTVSRNTPGATSPPPSGSDYNAIIGKFNRNTLAPIWIRYFGGNADDAAFSIRTLRDNTIVVGGGTRSPNFPTTQGSVLPVRTSTTGTNYDVTDGWIATFNPAGNLLNSTYVGGNQYDCVYFVEVDSLDNIYSLSQSSRKPGFEVLQQTGANVVYKFSRTLDRLLGSFRFGVPNSQPQISPTALMVDRCGQIYLSGWGGNLLGQSGSSLTTRGLPTTPDAYKTTTDGGDFYFMILYPSMDEIKYATFFGGNGSPSEHVDGGTSRFDPNGIIYQAVCASCGGTDIFPTTPGAYSTTNFSNNCNNGLIKFDFNPLFVPLQATVTPDSVCAGESFTYIHNARNSPAYRLFLDDSMITVFRRSQSFTFQQPGTYTLKLTGESPACPIYDSLVTTVVVKASPPLISDTAVDFCPSDTATISLPIDSRYTLRWTPAQSLLRPDTARNQAYTGNGQDYKVRVTDPTTGCSRETQVFFNQINTDLKLSSRIVNDACSDSVIINLSSDRRLPNLLWYLDSDSIGRGITVSIKLPKDSVYAFTSKLKNAKCPVTAQINVTAPKGVMKLTPEVDTKINYTSCTQAKVTLSLNTGFTKVIFREGKNVSEGSTYIQSVVTGDSILAQAEVFYGTCTALFDYKVKVPKLQVPNLVTNNGDEFNNVFTIKSANQAHNVAIYDRWGRPNYQSVQYRGEWPTSITPTGTYYFIIRLDEGKNCRGWVEIVR